MALLTTAPRGTGDVLPADSKKWQYVERKLLEIAELYGFRESRVPVFEHTELFTRSVGDTTDVVQKEMNHILFYMIEKLILIKCVLFTIQ